MRAAGPLLLLVALASCVGAPPRTPAPAPVRAPAPRPVPLPVATPAPDWRDWPVTPGTWVYRQDARGSIALFGPAGSDARLTLRCESAGRQLYLSVASEAATPITVHTTSQTRLLAVQPTGAGLAYVAAALAPADPLLDAMGFSRGRFAIEQAGHSPLVVPAWAEIERVTQDCRGG